MLVPRVLYSSNDSWANPVWKACSTKHMAHIHGRATLKSRLPASELVLLRALDETTREVCRVVTGFTAFTPDSTR
ncbi:hypothetical protein C8F04DRAFT_1123469 [Mycena alexandri]|uniref:Uncharacterized protein n=1 Tax=Mycena alexandri TaxID=1745969 RepID=A0AAD6SKA2_9AGAR|nr:hypothetical protein C8F04DRAFT_1123469 [Mycena alexandri]